MIVDLRTHVQMDSEINRSSSITNPQGAIHAHSQPCGDSREHMGSILYPRIRPVRHKAHRTALPPQQEAATAHVEPTPATADETQDKARRAQPEIDQAMTNPDRSLRAASPGSAATKAGDTK